MLATDISLLPYGILRYIAIPVVGEAGGNSREGFVCCVIIVGRLRINDLLKAMSIRFARPKL